MLHDSIRLSLDGVPVGTDGEKIREQIMEVADVVECHHLHIWAISTTETALTAHIGIENFSVLEVVKKEVKTILLNSGIRHVTLEFEDVENSCSEHKC